ncbi:unnamed protein product [Protopolystoma xenopodis]|uniref:Enhancer of yellow 2 transcription factor homolog n=1 Tax=Protopolystoma xenopodis TaxID=117903 RepID=A0A448XR67_9PLAT|nr:unnamed protein product [Protopolystoma xenopodis]
MSLNHLTISGPSQDIIEKVSRRLITSKESDRLLAYLPGRLSELGWNDRVYDECIAWLRQNTVTEQNVHCKDLPDPNKIKLETLVTALKPKVQSWIPTKVKMELMNRIMEFIGEQEIDE